MKNIANISKENDFSITVINDCFDENERLRITSRINRLFPGTPVSYGGVADSWQASGFLIDAVDSKQNSPALIIVNAAPRDEEAEQYENGSPFGYFVWNRILVIGTIQGLTFSLAKKMLGVKKIEVFDIAQVLKWSVEKKYLESAQLEHITNTQFRSYEFAPLVASLLLKGLKLPSSTLDADSIQEPEKSVWFIDGFGNCKTSVTTSELNRLAVDKKLKTRFGILPYFPRLVDAPRNKLSIVSGSSGLGSGTGSRFLEVVLRDGRASDRLNIKVGDKLFE